MDSVQLRDKQFEIFLPESILLKGIDNVATQINRDFKNKDPLFICILNGAFMFATELINRFHSECEIAFVRLKSYEGLERKKTMKEIHGLVENIENRHVLIIEDVIDTGYTMEHLLNTLNKKRPATVKIATLLFKPNALERPIKPDYVVQEIPNDFVVGFGLDYDGRGRNLRNIYKIKKLEN
ncbi:MAG: hypoxanthine phosphoribosyltransferase [Candidatus Azobacteroides sp.]|nr:hypoxanthine phosphoribosyltransferase [Candidatus Azobacteroides sp.]